MQIYNDGITTTESVSTTEKERGFEKMHRDIIHLASYRVLSQALHDEQANNQLEVSSPITQGWKYKD